MKIQAINLSIKAETKGSFVEHAIIFGYARHVSESCVVPYRMHTNFMGFRVRVRFRSLCRGKSASENPEVVDRYTEREVELGES